MPPMSTISIQRLNSQGFFFNGRPIGHNCPRIDASWTMTMRDPKNSSSGMKNTMEDPSMQLSISMPPAHKVETPRSGDLRFDRLQPSDHELVGHKILEFGQFVAREAVLDEEYWTAAWLRAESHWENPTLARHDVRYIHNYKLRFADQEFNELKKRCQMQNDQKCSCIIAVKKEHKNVKRPILKCVVGTLDLNIRYLLQGETFPGERGKAPRFCSINRTAPSRYGYIANVCVAKSARRQGIASNMLYYAVESAKTDGVEQVFVHVDRNNTTAQNLYQKIGFEVSSTQAFLLPSLIYLRKQCRFLHLFRWLRWRRRNNYSCFVYRLKMAVASVSPRNCWSSSYVKGPSYIFIKWVENNAKHPGVQDQPLGHVATKEPSCNQ